MKLKLGHVAASLAGALLTLGALLALCVSAADGPAVRTVCLGGGCDFATIQAAIDASAAGDEVRVSAEDYEEHLVISRALTLSGGWDTGFTQQNGQTVLDNPHASHPIGSGRMITASAEAITDVITIEHFTVLNGNASARPVTATRTSGLPEIVYFRGLQAGDAGEENYALPAGTPASRQTAQAARLDRLRPVRAPRDLAIPILAPEVLKPTKGGGLFITNASLRLLHANFYFNVASDLNSGVGGGVAAEDVGTVEVRDCIFKWNTGSSVYWGEGGGLWINGAAENGVQVVDSLFASNQAGFASDPTSKDIPSFGGGMAGLMARGIQVRNNVFQGNLASFYGTLGSGGGLQLISTRNAVVSGNRFEANTALARNRPQQTNDFGSGGGAEINLSRGAVVQDNLFQSNVAGAYMSGWGGGLSLNTSNGALIQRNTFNENWATFRMPEQLMAYHNAGGGGLLLNADPDAKVLSNTFSLNQAAYWQPPDQDTIYSASGGGMFAEQGIDHLLVAGNVFTANLASSNGTGRGGGLAAAYAQGDSITLRANQFLGNRASLNGPGLGGAVFASNDFIALESNLLQGNIASLHGDGYGGGAAFDRVQNRQAPQQVDLLANRFLENRAEAGGGGMGGGVYLRGSGGFTVTNNLLVRNAADLGGGLALSGELAVKPIPRTVANNTLVANQGQGVWSAGWPSEPTRLLNNIIAGHSLGIYAAQEIAGVASGPLTVDYTLFFANGHDLSGGGPVSLTHIIRGDPLFVNPAADNFRLQGMSPARDAGWNGAPAPAHDADGLPRPVGPAWDLGAYEWRGFLRRLPLIMRN